MEVTNLAFIVTATFLSAGLVALVLPWGFILTWIGRVIVWGFLGPHMKIVDLFLRANETKDGSLNDLVKNFDIQSNRARLRREEALKVKDMKEVAFGKFSVQVPSFNLCKCSRNSRSKFLLTSSLTYPAYLFYFTFCYSTTF